MSSIPLVALTVHPPEQPDLVGQYGRLLALRNEAQEAPLRQQALQQQVQSGGLAIQGQQRQQASQDALMQALTESNGDLGKAYSIAASSGKVLPDQLTALHQAHLTAQKTAIDLFNARGDAAVKEGDLFAGAVDAVKNAPPEARPQVYAQQLQQLQQLGVDVSQAPQQYPGDQALPGLVIGAQSHKAALDQVAKNAETQKNLAQANEATATANQKNAETAMGGTGAMADARFRNIEMNKRLGRPVSPEDQAFLGAYTKQKTLVPAYNFNLQANGIGGNAPLNPNQQATAQAILEGRMTPPSSFALKTPYWQNVMGAVFQQDPQFSEQRAQLRKDFTTGKHSTEINAINTAMAHVGVLGDAIDALDNNNIQVLNRIANSLGAQVGSDKMTTFNTIVHRVGPEIAKAYIGAGGSAGERGADEKDFDPALGLQQLKSNVAVTSQLLRSKIASLQNQWDQNKSDSMPSFEDRFIMPAAKQQLDKWAPEGGEGKSSGGLMGKVIIQNGHQYKVTAVDKNGKPTAADPVQ